MIGPPRRNEAYFSSFGSLIIKRSSEAKTGVGLKSRLKSPRLSRASAPPRLKFTLFFTLCLRLSFHGNSCRWEAQVLQPDGDVAGVRKRLHGDESDGGSGLIISGKQKQPAGRGLQRRPLLSFSRSQSN